MAFKVKDLMIDVAPGVGDAVFCRLCTFRISDYCWQCTNQITIDVCHVCTYYRPTLWCDYCSAISPVVYERERFTLPTCGATQTDFIDTGYWDVTGRLGVDQPGMVANPQNLAQLKAQLRQSLAQVEAQEQAMAESLKPQTLEEAEMLEQKLTEALDELRNHKEELRRSNR